MKSDKKYHKDKKSQFLRHNVAVRIKINQRTERERKYLWIDCVRSSDDCSGQTKSRTVSVIASLVRPKHPV